MRIVHFSDPHVFRPAISPGTFLDKRILGVLNMMFRRGASFSPELLAAAVRRIPLLAPDIVICTGDLTCTGTPEEFAAALDSLAPLVSGNTAWRFVYTPGNHDAYVRTAVCREALSHAFTTLNSEKVAISEGHWWLNIGPLEIMVLNEALPTALWLSSGRMRDGTLDAVRAWAGRPRKPGRKRIVVGHFPLRDARGRRLPFNRRVQGDRMLAAELEAGRIDVMLCGHIHTPFLREEPNGTLEACAGSVTAAGLISVLDYVPEDGRFRHFWVDLRGDGKTMAPAGPGLAAAGFPE